MGGKNPGGEPVKLGECYVLWQSEYQPAHQQLGPGDFQRSEMSSVEFNRALSSDRDPDSCKDNNSNLFHTTILYSRLNGEITLLVEL